MLRNYFTFRQFVPETPAIAVSRWSKPKISIFAIICKYWSSANIIHPQTLIICKYWLSANIFYPQTLIICEYWSSANRIHPQTLIICEYWLSAKKGSFLKTISCFWAGAVFICLDYLDYFRSKYNTKRCSGKPLYRLLM